MPRFRLESLDVNFEYQEKLLKSVEQGIKETKKKLNDTEIMLTLEPNKVDLQEWMRWEKSMDSIINRPANLNFPNLSRMKKDNEMRKLSQMEATRKSKMASRDAAALQAQRIMSKQTQNMQKKILEGKCKFGSSVEGEEIGVMEHYHGTNTYEISGKRVLRRKDGRNHVVDPEQPDLPPWMGPMYYFDAQKSRSQSTISERFYRLPFQASGDGHRSAAVIGRENLTRRRKQLRSAIAHKRQFENELSSEELLIDSSDHNRSVSFQKSFADIKASIERDDKGEPDPDWEEVYRLSENSSVRTSANKSTHSYHLDDHSSVESTSEVSFGNMSSAPPPSIAMGTEQSLTASELNNENGRTTPTQFSGQLASDDTPAHPPRKQSSTALLNALGTASNTRAGHRVTLLNPPPPVLSSSLSVGSISSSTMSATTFDSSHQSKSRGKKQEQSIDPRLSQCRHRVVLDPLMTHHAYALKILQSDPSVQQAASYGQLSTLNPHLQMYQQQKHQPNRTKDYTFHALANQTPLVLDNFNIENSVASVAQQMQQQQQQQMLQQLSGIGGGMSVPIFIDTQVTTSGSNTSRVATANGNNNFQLKYSSDVFKKPLVDYRTSEELWKEAKVKFNASHLVPDPFSSPGAGKVTSNSTNNNSRTGTASTANANANATDKHLSQISHGHGRGHHGEIRVSSDAMASMELSMQLLNQSRATSAAHRSTQPYGLLATVDLYSSSKPSSSPNPVDVGGRNASPLPRHMSPPKSSPLRDHEQDADIIEPLVVDDFPVSVSDLLTTSEPISQMIDEFMVSHDVHCSRDFNAYSSKRRQRKSLDTNRDGKTKSKYRSKVRGMTPAKNTTEGSDTWDAASVLQELAEMKGLLLDEDPENVYPALIQANKDRDIDNIILR